MTKKILIVTTLDTKGDEAEYLKEKIEEQGLKTLVIDVGILGDPYLQPDITREEVSARGGKSHIDLLKEYNEGASRENAISIMKQGLVNVLKDLDNQKMIHGMVGLGGGTGTKLITDAMQELPIGIPKLQIATNPRGEHFGILDIVIMKSVVDLIGLNNIIRRILLNAANAIVGMARNGMEIEFSEKKTVGITSWGVVTKGAMRVGSYLKEYGYEPLFFHGVTKPLEYLIKRGQVNSVIDLCANELIDLHICSTKFSSVNPAPSKERLELVGEKNLPRIFTPGTLDGAFFPVNTIYSKRKKTEHTKDSFLVRTSKDELIQLGQIIANKANRIQGPVAIAIPLQGFSANDFTGGVLYDPKANQAFVRTIEKETNKNIKVVKVDAHINSDLFAKAIVDLLRDLFNSIN